MYATDLTRPAFCLQPPKIGYGTLKCVGFVPYGKPQISPREHALNLLAKRPKEAIFRPREIKAAVWKDTSRYSGEELRVLRKAYGVGRLALSKTAAIEQLRRLGVLPEAEAWAAAA